MKRLLILRHGKSDWDAGYERDHQRPLAPRGERASLLVGGFLGRSGWVPDRVLTSSALRARTTAALAVEAAGWTVETEVTGALYGTDPGAVVGLLRRLADDIETVLIAGHEPTWSGLLAHLTGARARMPTAAVAGVELPASHWSELRPSTGTLRFLVTPKVLAGRETGGSQLR